jgi:hypothetical protein
MIIKYESIICKYINNLAISRIMDFFDKSFYLKKYEIVDFSCSF